MAGLADADLDEVVREHPDGATVALRVVPRAPRTAVVGLHGAAVKLKIQAPPVDGAANAAVAAFVADLAGVRSAEVTLLAGEHGRDKVVLVRGLSAEALRAVLRSA